MLQKLSDRIQQFSQLLENVDVSSISEHVYCRNYLQHLLDHRRYYIEMYDRLLQLLLQKSNLEIGHLSVVDMGCGNGLMGLYFKFCGIGKVELLDTDAWFMEAAKKLSVQMNIPADGFLVGDVSVLQNQSMPDAIVGTDVIEHVYDVQQMLQLLKVINPSIITLFTTASNPENKWKVNKLMKLQWKDEHMGGVLVEGIAGHEPHKAYKQMRREIIEVYTADISASAIEKMVACTRGMKMSDIHKALDHFLLTKQFPPQPDHPTNTCDPYTGSWTERILTLDAYREMYKSNGFHLDLYAGFFNHFSGGFFAMAKKILNVCIRFIGLPIAPFIILAGTKKVG